MATKRSAAPKKAPESKPSNPNAARDAAIEAFVEQDTASPDAAFELVDAVGLDAFQKDFQRRNGCLPQLHGWPLVELSNGTRISLDPSHECNFEHGRGHIAGGLISLLPSNGR